MNHIAFRSVYQQMLALLPQGVHWYPPQPPYFTGYAEGVLFDWDQYFEAIALLYAGFPCDYTLNGIDIFLSRQKDSGLIERSVPPGGGATNPRHRVHVKPFLAQEALLCIQSGAPLQWLRQDERYERLQRYLDFWLHDCDVRDGGLSVWQEAGHTGMDNHHERAGRWEDRTAFCEGVDLNAYLVRECRAFALLAECLGREGDRDAYRAAADARAAVMQATLWSEADGCFYDYDAQKKTPISVKYVGMFLPLWAGVATAEQAWQLVERHLLNEKEFRRPYPLPVLAADEPGYVEGSLDTDRTGCCSWRAHMWVPTNYMVCQGLRQYGFDQPAADLARQTRELFERAPFSEYYTSESGLGTGRKPFRGWSMLAPFMEAEMEQEADPTRLRLDNHAVTKMRTWIQRTMCGEAEQKERQG